MKSIEEIKQKMIDIEEHIKIIDEAFEDTDDLDAREALLNEEEICIGKIEILEWVLEG